MRKNKLQHLPFFAFFPLCFTLIALNFSVCTLIACKQEGPWKPGMPLPKEKIKIGVIYSNEYDRKSFYDNAHYEGILEMQKNIGLTDNQIISKANVFDGDSGVAEGVMRDCIAEGTNIIIATSVGYQDVCEKLANEFQNIIFIQAMGNKSNNTNFTHYTTKLYQARYLSGIVAGLKTESGKIGFVAAWGKDNSEVSGGINAFAIGVEEVNPNAKIYVQVIHSWYDPMGETDAANALIAEGCDVITAHSNTSNAQTVAERNGVWSIGFNSDMALVAPDAVITSVVPNWGVVYTQFVESLINGNFKPASNFYGLVEGAVGITPINEKLASPGTGLALEVAKKRIREGFNVFDGLLKTNDGRTIGQAGKTLSDAVILGGINWYYHNVIEQ